MEWLGTVDRQFRLKFAEKGDGKRIIGLRILVLIIFVERIYLVS
jgi:hypothetical protein